MRYDLNEFSCCDVHMTTFDVWATCGDCVADELAKDIDRDQVERPQMEGESSL